MVRHCAKMFAVKNMDAWLEQLTAYANAGSEAGETLACNVMLLAEATKEPALALTVLPLSIAVDGVKAKASAALTARVEGLAARGAALEARRSKVRPYWSPWGSLGVAQGCSAPGLFGGAWRQRYELVLVLL